MSAHQQQQQLQAAQLHHHHQHQQQQAQLLQQPPHTPASEIVHLVTSFSDSLDALPPTLTRSLSDLKELDAVLSGSLTSITQKLQRLLVMMHTPNPTPAEREDGVVPKITPLERLKLLREVTEDARIFRLGGEDKIRVATSTCETIATHNAHLAQLSHVLLDFLPPSLLPLLPAPSAPHGYPASSTPATSLARRQNFDYPIASHPGSGSTVRMNAALGMVREHWELTRGRDRERPSTSKKRDDKPKESHSAHGGTYGHPHAAVGGSSAMAAGGAASAKDKDPTAPRHPNQYTKKKLLAAAQAQAQAAAAQAGTTHSIATGPGGMTAIEAVREKRKAGELGAGAGAGGKSANGGGAGPAQNASTSQDDFGSGAGAASGANGGRTQKRKGEDAANANKRRKKGPEATPAEAPRATPAPIAAASSAKAPRRANSKLEEAAPAPAPAEEEEAADGMGDEDDGDGRIYCICDRVSFGDMIGCDGSDCEREWFHLPCVGLQVIPKGRWLCEDCRKRPTDKAKKRK